MASRKQKTKIRHIRLRKKVSGTTERPRLSVHFSRQHVYAQIIDDEKGVTITSVNTTEALFRIGAGSNVETAQKVGIAIAERAKNEKIEKIVFDRGGFQYHGKVKALAEAARNGGLKF